METPIWHYDVYPLYFYLNGVKTAVFLNVNFLGHLRWKLVSFSDHISSIVCPFVYL